MKFVFNLLLVLFSYSNVFAQPQPVDWSYEVEQVQPSEYQVTFVATIDPGWAVYSQHLDPEKGPIPTSFSFEKDAQLQLIGQPEEKGNKKEGFDPIFEMNLIKYTDQVRFSQIVKTTSATGGTLKAQVRFMTCNSKSCLPPATIDFSVDLNKG